jgi:hypothetical protein
VNDKKLADLCQSWLAKQPRGASIDHALISNEFWRFFECEALNLPAGMTLYPKRKRFGPLFFPLPSDSFWYESYHSQR